MIILVSKKSIAPEQAIKELNGLQMQHAVALIELYDQGLRGSHLRQWYTSHPRQFFTPTNLECLLKGVTDEEKSIFDAIESISESPHLLGIFH